MYKAGIINNAVAEMVRLKSDVMGISEMTRPGNGKCIVDNHKVYHFGNENNKHMFGVSVIADCKTQIALLYYIFHTIIKENNSITTYLKSCDYKYSVKICSYADRT